MRHRLTPLLALCLAPTAAPAHVRLVEAGIVCPREARGALVEAPGTEAGVIRQIEEATAFDLFETTVPTVTNLSFGLRVALEPGEPSRDVTIVVTHPPMGTRAVVRQAWDDVILAGSESINLFTFEHDYEKVVGRWTFGVEVDGAPVVEVPFDVSEADGRGAVEAACFQFLS